MKACLLEIAEVLQDEVELEDDRVKQGAGKKAKKTKMSHAQDKPGVAGKFHQERLDKNTALRVIGGH